MSFIVCMKHAAHWSRFGEKSDCGRASERRYSSDHVSAACCALPAYLHHAVHSLLPPEFRGLRDAGPAVWLFLLPRKSFSSSKVERRGVRPGLHYTGCRSYSSVQSPVGLKSSPLPKHMCSGAARASPTPPKKFRASKSVRTVRLYRCNTSS